MIEIPLGKKQLICLIDEEDLPLIKAFKWATLPTQNKRNFYAISNKYGGFLYMHRLILQAQKGQIVDHINHNGLDNRRKNLRLCTQRENCLNNQGWLKKSSSPYKGVWKVSKLNGKNGGSPFEAKISIDGHQRYIGAFKTAEEAARAYDEYAKTFHGRFAHLNFPNAGLGGRP